MSYDWNKWGGSQNCPIDDDARVMVRCADGHDRGPFRAEGLKWNWTHRGYHDDIVEYKVVGAEASTITSDGGSSDYYKLTIDNKAGDKIECEMGDVIRCVYGDNFNLGNIAKAARRMYEASQGRGKEGTSIEYDGKKIHYFTDEFVHWNEGK